MPVPPVGASIDCGKYGGIPKGCQGCQLSLETGASIDSV